MHVESHKRPRLLNELQEVTPKRLLMGDNIARCNVWLKLCLFSQITSQDQDSCIGLFYQLYEAWLGQGPVARPVIPLTTLVAVCYVVQLLKAPRL